MIAIWIEPLRILLCISKMEGANCVKSPESERLCPLFWVAHELPTTKRESSHMPTHHKCLGLTQHCPNLENLQPQFPLAEIPHES